ncbi:M20/M25/M40 family metallo-hydrolase [Sphingomonas canadensis]|uniref:M20/M25/M40 family metallo-hydrolase n=2 Tax=Sphingomonas canadensis TaxID=1219257 RepID=A0ABW3HDB1_9SPHN|nr:M20/M25/M40 family metallo-hydrolase [Sphingomonas canadensis]MCW3837500.1 M20/M25/M40 family metallo-hydrolase [Sphingomonas canadensis]
MIFAALSLALAVTPFAAQSQTAATAPSFRPEAVKAHVEFLADDLLEGRNAGTRGYEIAARYVATRFEALGLKPGGADGSWYQQVPLAEFRIDLDKPATVKIGARTFEYGTDMLVGAAPRAGVETVSGGTVFVGYGLRDDYAGLDVKGKFVVALTGMPKGFTPEQRAAAQADDKLVLAKEKGAVGLISLVTPDAVVDGYPWAAVMDFTASPRATWIGPDGMPAGQEGQVALQFYVKGEAAAALFAGSPKTADQIYAELKQPGARPGGFALAATPSLTRTSISKSFTSPNVLGVLPGSDPALAKEYVVLSAHLDHDGRNDGLPGDDKVYNGAMDNAAGIATMLEVARAFAEGGKRPRRSILFVALTAEEDGLLGSDYLAHYPTVGAGRMVADVNLDMPVLLYDFTDVVAFGAEHSTLGPIVARATGSVGVKLAPDPMPEENLFVRSDHYSFVQKGVPSVFLMTGFANGGEAAFRGFLAHTYHTPADQADQPGFNWAAGAKFALINYRIAREIADAEQAPRWYEGNMYGDRYAPGQPRAKKAPDAP